MPRSDRARLRSTGVVPDGPIRATDQRYQYLLPEYEFPCYVEGRWYRTAEHALLASSLEHDGDRSQIARCGTVTKARALHWILHQRRPRPGWKTHRAMSLMAHIYRERFSNQTLRDHLVGTFPAAFDLLRPWLNDLLTRLRDEYRLGIADESPSHGDGGPVPPEEGAGV